MVTQPEHLLNTYQIAQEKNEKVFAPIFCKVLMSNFSKFWNISPTFFLIAINHLFTENALTDCISQSKIESLCEAQ